MRVLIAIFFTLSYTLISTQELTIRAIDVVDVERGVLLKAQDVLIKSGKIQQVSDHQGTINSQDIDGTGKFLIPGLIDAHMHLFQSGGLYTRPDALDLRDVKSYEDEIQWTRDNAGDILSRYLACGITTVIDVGGPMYHYTLRDSLNQDLKSATVYLTGPLISTYQPEEFQIEDPPIIKVSDEAAAIALVQQQLPYKPDFIKIWYIALKPQDALDNYPIIEATVKEAHAHDLPVAIHATELTTAKLALKAGADYLVHGVDDIELDDEFINLMRASNTVLAPTLMVSSQYNKVFLSEYQISDEDYQYAPPIPLGSVSDLKHLEEPELIRTYKQYKSRIDEMDAKRILVNDQNLIKLIQNDIPIALGTDAGNVGTMHASSFFQEIREMQELGISAKTILKSATIDAARSIHKNDLIGTIEAGKAADLVILEQNPLEDIMAIKSLHVIIHQGEVFDPEEIIRSTPEMLVQQQLNAYNGHDLEAFLRPYAEDVKVYNFPDQLSFEGKSVMRERYQFVEQAPDLYCQVVNRTVMGNTVIDHERVVFDKTQDPAEVIAVYKIKDGQISEVYFID